MIMCNHTSLGIFSVWPWPSASVNVIAFVIEGRLIAVGKYRSRPPTSKTHVPLYLCNACTSLCLCLFVDAYVAMHTRHMISRLAKGVVKGTKSLSNVFLIHACS